MADSASHASGVAVLAPGDLIASYVVEKLLGKGGMGSVYLVRGKDGGRFAVKLLSPQDGAKGDDFRKRFLREGEFERKIRHPNLISVYEVGVDSATGLNYIVMEYAPGGSVRDRLNRIKRYDIAEAVEVIRQVAYGLAAAHRHGVVHRDIKPDNILFAADGTPKLTDLGVAKFTSESGQTTMTSAEEVVGTPAYMSPEQMINAHEVDPRSDIYALGVVFYEMLAGQRPNESDTYIQLLSKAVRGIPLPSIRKMRPEVSAALVQVINVMCAMKASDRFESSEKLIDVFERLKREGFDAKLGLRMPPNYRRRRFLAVAVPLFIAALASGFAVYDRTATFTELYGDWVDEWCVPVGINHIEDEDAAKASHYRFEYRGRRSLFGGRILRKVTQFDEIGRLRDTQDVFNGRRPAVINLSYNEDGRLSYIDCVDSAGQICGRRIYSGADMRYVDFKMPERGGGLVAMFSRHTSTGGGWRYISDSALELDDADMARIRRHAVTRDERGHVVQIEFMSGDENEPVADSRGVFGVKYECNGAGQPVAVRWVDESGNGTADNEGISLIVREYDEKGRILSNMWYDASTNSVLCEDGFARQTFSYGASGERTAISYFDKSGKPCMVRNTRMSETRFSYNEDERAMRTTYHGVDGEALRQYNFAAGCEVRALDGNIVSKTWLDENGMPCIRQDGFAMLREELDGCGRILAIRCFDDQGHAVCCSSGYHAQLCSYDDYGNLREERFLDADDNPVRTVEGVTTVLSEYDLAGRRTRTRYVDGNGKPSNTSWNCAEESFFYDRGGNVSRISFFGEDGKPCTSAYGAPVIVQKFNAQGFLCRQDFLGTDGKPAKSCSKSIFTCSNCLKVHDPCDHYPWKGYLAPFGVAGATLKYTKRGTIEEICYFDESGNPCADSNGCAVERHGYDNNGFRSSVDYFAVDGSRTGTGRRYENDVRGRCVVMSFIGTDGLPVVDKKFGYAKRRIKYDELNRVVERSYYDEKDEPMLNRPSLLNLPKGIFRIEHRSNDADSMRENFYYGLDGKPCLSERGYGGVRSIFSEFGEVYVEFLGIGGTRQNFPEKGGWGIGGWFGFEQSFNVRGNVVKKMHFDKNYDYVMVGNKSGFLKVLDAMGVCVSELNLGVDEKPHKTPDGKWGWHLVEDEKNPGKKVRKPILDKELADSLFAKGMAAVVNPRNRTLDEWKKVRLDRVPLQDD